MVEWILALMEICVCQIRGRERERERERERDVTTSNESNYCRRNEELTAGRKILMIIFL